MICTFQAVQTIEETLQAVDDADFAIITLIVASIVLESVKRGRKNDRSAKRCFEAS